MKQLNIDSFLGYNFLSSPSISPDGSMTAFVVQTADLKKNGYNGDIYLADTEGENVSRLTSLGDAKGFIWSKANTVVFPAMRGDKYKDKAAKGEEFTVYYEINPKGGEAVEAFVVPLRVGKIESIDDETYVLTASYDNTKAHLEGMCDEDKAKALKEMKEAGHVVFDELPFWSNGRGVVNGKRTRLYIYTRSTGEVKALTAPKFNVGGFQVNNGKIMYTGSMFENVMVPKSGLFLYDIESGKTDEVIAPGTFYVGANGLLDDCIIVAKHDGTKHGSGQYPNLYKIALSDYSITHIADYDGSVGGSSVGSDCRNGGGNTTKVLGDKFYFLTTDKEHSYIRSIDKEGNISDFLTEKGATDCFDMNENMTMLVGLRGLALTELYKSKDGSEKKITCFNDKVHEDTYVATPEEVFFTATDGYEVHGYVLKPYDYKEGESYPAILHIHGGPRTVFSDCYHHEMQMWANKGYFVLYSNPRGSDGRGNDFGDIRGKYGTVDYQNLMDFTDECLKKYPDIDIKRVGVTGGSYGGFMTNWIIGHTHRFAAACAQRSIANWVAFEGTADIGPTFAADQMQATTHTDIDKMWFHSPLKYANLAKTPTLFIHAEEDYRCWMVEALSMFTALKLHDVPSKMFLFKGENHELSRSGRPQQRIKRMEEILAWMDNYLKV